MEWITSPEIWISLLTLTGPKIIPGIDTYNANSSFLISFNRDSAASFVRRGNIRVEFP